MVFFFGIEDFQIETVQVVSSYELVELLEVC
jgi:hypothetical protein